MARYGKCLDSKTVVEFSLDHDHIRDLHSKDASIDEMTAEIEAEADLIIHAVQSGQVTPLKFNDSHPLS